MSKRAFNVNVYSVDSIKDCINQLKQYRDSIPDRAKRIVERLAEIGVNVAYENASGSNSHKFENRVYFTSRVDSSVYGCTGVMMGIGESFPSRWFDSDGVEHNDTIEPLLMLEFGSGIYALPPQSAFGGYGGQGTMATRGNENSASWWFATDLDENGKPTNWHLGTAVTPTRPMYHAWTEMYRRIYEVAKEVFND